MADNPHHEHLIKELAEQLEPIFTGSLQAVYLYLDDEHKVCNQKYAQMLEYNSIDEWVNNQHPVSDVLEKDRNKVIDAYSQASGNFKASAINVSLTTKKGKIISTEVIMVPITFGGEVFVLHFITPK